MVSGTISLPSRGAFHLSLTVLVHYRWQRVFSLRRWSSQIPTGFLVSRGTWVLNQQVSYRFAYRALTVYGRLFLNRSATIEIGNLPGGIGSSENPVPRPPWRNAPTLSHATGLGSSRFARHYSGNRCCFLFLGLLRCFSSPGTLPAAMYSPQDSWTLLQESCLIRGSPDRSLFAAPRSVSPLTAPFIGSLPQGIHHSLFVA